MKTAQAPGRVPIRYLLYGTAAFCILVAVFFPYRRLADNLVTRLEERTGFRLRYQDMGYAFPAGCRLDQVEILWPLGGRRVPVFRGERLTLRLAPLALLRGDLGLACRGLAYGGEARGEARLPLPLQAASGTYHLRFSDLRYEEIVAPFYLRDFKISGNLSGEAELRGEGKAALGDWGGTLQAVLRQGKIRNLFVRDMPLRDFTFREIRAVADLSGGVLDLRDCTIDSDVFAGEVKGKITLHPGDLRESRLDLSARLKPAPQDPVNLHGVATFFQKTLDAGGYYPFVLTGTFRYPQLQ